MSIKYVKKYQICDIVIFVDFYVLCVKFFYEITKEPDKSQNNLFNQSNLEKKGTQLEAFLISNHMTTL